MSQRLYNAQISDHGGDAISLKSGEVFIRDSYLQRNCGAALSVDCDTFHSVLLEHCDIRSNTAGPLMLISNAMTNIEASESGQCEIEGNNEVRRPFGQRSAPDESTVIGTLNCIGDADSQRILGQHSWPFLDQLTSSPCHDDPFDSNHERDELIFHDDDFASVVNRRKRTRMSDYLYDDNDNDTGDDGRLSSNDEDGAY